MLKYIELTDIFYPGTQKIEFVPGINNTFSSKYYILIHKVLRAIFFSKRLNNTISFCELIQNTYDELASTNVLLSEDIDLLLNLIYNTKSRQLVSESIYSGSKTMAYIDPCMISYIDDKTNKEIIREESLLHDRYPILDHLSINKYTELLNTLISNVYYVPVFNPNLINSYTSRADIFNLEWIYNFYKLFRINESEVEKTWNEILPKLDINISRVVRYSIFTDTGIDIGFANIGSGAQRLMYVLPMIYHVLNLDTAKTLILDEPLSGVLHPLLEKAILELWLEKGKDKQLILPTTLHETIKSFNNITDLA